MMRCLLILTTVLCITACERHAGNTPVILDAEKSVAENSARPVSASLFTLSVQPALLARGTRADITLDVRKSIEGRFLLIDREGRILHRFHEGSFEEKRYAFHYTPSARLTLGAYILILADEDNNVVVSREITLSDNVMKALREPV